MAGLEPDSLSAEAAALAHSGTVEVWVPAREQELELWPEVELSEWFWPEVELSE